MLRLLALSLFSVFALTACRKAEPVGEDSKLLVEVKETLARRDAKVQSYRVDGTVTEAGQVVKYEFFYRAPNRMLGKFSAPQERTLAFDGKQLYDVVPANKRFTRVELKAQPQAQAEKLTQLFLPFVPDGYRAPLVNLKDVKARFGTHPRAAKTVELVQQLDEGGTRAEVKIVMRYPALDFLERSLVSGASRTEVRVEEEHCEEKLGMCFPLRLTQTNDGEAGAVTQLSALQINAAIPTETFSLQAPDGYASATSEMKL